MVRAMRVYADHRAVPPGLACAVTIGNFDGRHRGHAALLAEVSQLALARGLTRAVLTFEPHPLVLLAPERAPLRVVTAAEKRRLLAEADVDVLFEQPFTREFAALTPEAFAGEVLAGHLGARHVVVGYDFRYGAGRAGNADTLVAAGARHGFTVTVVSARCLPDGTPASSSLVRRAVLAGDLERATSGLGRPYAIVGEVVHGDRRGHGLGYPTANIRTEFPLLPPHGVYAGWLEVGTEVRPAAINLGTRPTFKDGPSDVRIEAHAIDTPEVDLYGQTVRLHFVSRLRPELRFDGPDALKAAIAKDVDDARRALAQAQAPRPVAEAGAPVAPDA